MWNIDIKTAKRALHVTTQKGVRTAIHPLLCRYCVNHLHWKRRQLKGDWYSDTLFSEVTSLQVNVCAQQFTNGNDTLIHPLSLKSKVGQALTEFSDDGGIPDLLMTDGALEMIGLGTDFMKEVNRLKIRMRRSEVGRSNQNHAAEREIGELKKRWQNQMLKKKVPTRLWDYGLLYESRILNRIPQGSQQRTGLEIVTGRHLIYPNELILNSMIVFGFMIGREWKWMTPGGSLQDGLELLIGSGAINAITCCYRVVRSLREELYNM